MSASAQCHQIIFSWSAHIAIIIIFVFFFFLIWLFRFSWALWILCRHFDLYMNISDLTGHFSISDLTGAFFSKWFSTREMWKKKIDGLQCTMKISTENGIIRNVNERRKPKKLLAFFVSFSTASEIILTKHCTNNEISANGIIWMERQA